MVEILGFGIAAVAVELAGELEDILVSLISRVPP